MSVFCNDECLDYKIQIMYYLANFHSECDYPLQLGKGGWRRPLTMGNQESETKEEFCARRGLSEPIDFKGGPMPFNLKSHHTEGPSKVVI